MVWAKFGLFQRGFYQEPLSERAIMLLISQFESPRSDSEELGHGNKFSGENFFLTERHRKLDKISCSLPVLMSTLFLVHYLWRVKSMFISYCCYSFIGQKAKMYITGLKSKCQKACFFFLETSGEKPFFVFSCF